MEDLVSPDRPGPLRAARADALLWSGIAVSWGFVTSHLSSNGQSGNFGDFDEDEEDDPHQVPEIFVAGVYQAVYDFEPELETEMRMTTGDVVSVWERQCDGWVSRNLRPHCSPR